VPPPLEGFAGVEAALSFFGERGSHQEWWRTSEEQKTTIERQESRIRDLEVRLARLEAALAGDR